ncbi:ComEA family DNA-binding protein [Pedobacter faecalis]|uniref:ComEA family DNA-binding protein n=1 Tax=Pedobacter faecalis TaxID=3041495 RepID=UPI00254C82A0|nr:helix-hairpin-helix domain-containing protein [Pedobacter sp. ELA7]
MRQWINQYFSLSKREFNAVLFLIALIAALALCPYFFSPSAEISAKERETFRAEIEALVASERVGYHNRTSDMGSVLATASRPTAVRLFYFDPNKMQVDDWERLGLSPRQAAAVVKYVTAGGSFKRPEDLQKMYTISKVQYQRLVPFVRIDAPVKQEVVVKLGERMPGVGLPVRTREVIELNTADSTRLCEIDGVGPAFARRIIVYRQRLGGFFKKEQLLEVFGLDSVRYNQIAPQVSIDVTQLKKININTADHATLKRLPYLRYKQINALIEYRNQHGSYGHAADLAKIAILTPDIIERVVPYLTF